MSLRPPYFRMAAALLALLGLFDAAYLAIERALGNSGVFCPTGGGCTLVQESAYSAIMRVATLGWMMLSPAWTRRIAASSSVAGVSLSK